MKEYAVTWKPAADRTDLHRSIRESEGRGMLLDIVPAYEPMGIILTEGKFIQIPLSMLRVAGS